MSLRDLLEACRVHLPSPEAGLAAPHPAFTLFFSLSDGEQRAHVVHARADTLAAAWSEGAERLLGWAVEHKPAQPWLRVDWIEGATALSWSEFDALLSATKRNYYRHGLALDADFSLAFTEQELNANAMLYGGPDVPHAVLNRNNFAIYTKSRFQRSVVLDIAPEQTVYQLTMAGVFCGPDGVAHPLGASGPDAGRRRIETLNPHEVFGLVRDGAAYLARQVQDDGLFVYGHFPCFDRRIPTYNTLRHASSLYAMIEAWELTRDAAQKEAIERATLQLTGTLIRSYILPDGEEVAYLVDVGEEIKLGGNAVCLLALVKYCEAFGTRRWLPLLEKLALGIAHMQDAASGRFDHVLNATDLSLKQAARVIYYDGEAAFGLMRLYGLTRDARWLAVVEKAFDYFIAARHWQAHDHWLSYCVNELTRWSPQEKYFRFGIQNVAGYLDFVLERQTTFPTLLELMLAAQQMLQRLQGLPQMRHLLDELDTDKFERALEHRAHYLLNGVFWPEVAMYFKRPSTVLGSFFIRHHSFRVRIDDVEHYLSGFIAYHRHLLERRAVAPIALAPVVQPLPEAEPEPAEPRDARGRESFWTAELMAKVTGGEWVAAPEPGWHATGVAQRAYLRKGRVMVAYRERRPRQAAAVTLNGVLQPAAAVLCNRAEHHVGKQVPVLQVTNTRHAVMQLGAWARKSYRGEVIGVAGGSAKAMVATMLSSVLADAGEVGRTEGNVSLPPGIAWNMTCMPQAAPFWVIELAAARMSMLAQLARPTLTLVVGSAATLLKSGDSARTFAQKESAVFRGMPAGGCAVINRDIPEFEVFAQAARESGQRVLTYGEHSQADLRLVGFHHGEVQAELMGTPARFRLSAPGQQMGMNALAVLAVLAALQQPLGPAIERLSRFEPTGGRGLPYTIPIGDGSFKLIDETYDANPASMRAALALLGQTPCEPAQRVAILGDMQQLGADAQRYHLGLEEELLAAQPDRVLLCGPQMEALHLRVQHRLRSHWFGDVSSLSAALGGMLRPGDWVLVKSSARVGLSRLARVLKALP